MAEMGRPTLYNEKYNEQARKLCLLGYSDKELAGFFEVSESTINKWKKDYPDFSESIKAGKENADAEVAASLYERAKGYSHKEDKIFNDNGKALIVPTVRHHPPDVRAAEIWLHNRQRARWKKDPSENNDKGGFKLPFGKSSVKK